VETAYIVTQGIYSDYGIRGVFSSTKAAEGFITTEALKPRGEWDQDFNATSFNLECFMRDNDIEIEEHPVDIQAVGNTQFCVYFAAYAIISVQKHSEEYSSYLPYYNTEIYSPRKEHGNPADHHTYVWAKDEAAATKIANERRAMWLAQQQETATQS